MWSICKLLSLQVLVQKVCNPPTLTRYSYTRQRNMYGRIPWPFAQPPFGPLEEIKPFWKAASARPRILASLPAAFPGLFGCFLRRQSFIFRAVHRQKGHCKALQASRAKCMRNEWKVNLSNSAISAIDNGNLDKIGNPDKCLSVVQSMCCAVLYLYHNTHLCGWGGKRNATNGSCFEYNGMWHRL